MNLQFSCSFFLQSEGTQNGRLRERAGRSDVLAVAERADSALCGDCGCRWKLPGSCCPEDCCWDQELQASGGGSRSFGGFAKRLRLQELQGLRSSGAPRVMPPQPVWNAAVVVTRVKCFSSSTENHF